jgi:hypothetical protein
MDPKRARPFRSGAPAPDGASPPIWRRADSPPPHRPPRSPRLCHRRRPLPTDHPVAFAPPPPPESGRVARRHLPEPLPARSCRPIHHARARPPPALGHRARPPPPHRYGTRTASAAAQAASRWRVAPRRAAPDGAGASPHTPAAAASPRPPRPAARRRLRRRRRRPPLLPSGAQARPSLTVQRAATRRPPPPVPARRPPAPARRHARAAPCARTLGAQEARGDHGQSRGTPSGAGLQGSNRAGRRAPEPAVALALCLRRARRQERAGPLEASKEVPALLLPPRLREVGHHRAELGRLRALRARVTCARDLAPVALRRAAPERRRGRGAARRGAAYAVHTQLLFVSLNDLGGGRADQRAVERAQEGAGLLPASAAGCAG